MEILWRDNSTCPTIDQYLTMVKNKTGGLLRLAIGLMQQFSKSTLDVITLVDILGYVIYYQSDGRAHFQIRDDYINLTRPTSESDYAEDLTEGKYSFPIIHAITHDKNNIVQSLSFWLSGD